MCVPSLKLLSVLQVLAAVYKPVISAAMAIGCTLRLDLAIHFVLGAHLVDEAICIASGAPCGIGHAFLVSYSLLPTVVVFCFADVVNGKHCMPGCSSLIYIALRACQACCRNTMLCSYSVLPEGGT